jgi:hypothetical protein
VAEFPRGWMFHTMQNGSGVAASITAPAITGVVRILDSMLVKLANNGSAAVNAFVLTVTISGTGVLTALLITQAFNGSTDELSLSNLDLASTPGGTIVVAFGNVAGAGIWEQITIQGHDI